tara:strand:- start:918 stop:1019 length:102 start_codon:yes stop_codon:yes gene_type:complete
MEEYMKYLNVEVKGREALEIQRLEARLRELKGR